MDTRNAAFEGFASLPDTQMEDNPADRSDMTNPSLTTSSADSQSPGQSLSLDTFEKNSRDIIRHARELGADDRHLNFIRVQQEQLRTLFLEATKTVAASAANVQGYKNHQDFARHYSIELKLAVEQCSFVSDDHRRYKAELEELNKQLDQVSKGLNDAMRAQGAMKKEHEAMKKKQEASERENETLKRDMKELQQLLQVHVL